MAKCYRYECTDENTIYVYFSNTEGGYKDDVVECLFGG